MKTNEGIPKALLAIVIVVILISSYVVAANWPWKLEGSIALMVFTVAEIDGDGMVLVADNDGYGWWFEQPDFKCYVGMLVEAETPMHRTDEGTWKFDIENSVLIGKKNIGI